MPTNITSNYSGEVLEALLTQATTGNELVAGGHIRLEPNVQTKFHIPRLKAGSMLQKRKEQPTSADSKGDFNYDEKTIVVNEFMAYTEFNPRSFEKIWRPYQPKGPLVFSELAPHVQNALLAEMAKVVDFELGEYFVTGEFGAGDNQLFNGILTIIKGDAEVIKVPTPVAITQDNVIAKLKASYAALPKAVKKQKNLKCFMSMEDAELYDDALSAQPNKGKNWTDKNPERFKSKPIVALASWPKDVIVWAVASTSLDTNLWGAVAYSEDDDVIQIDKVTNAGERYFFKMLLKAETQVAFGDEIVLYDART